MAYFADRNVVRNKSREGGFGMRSIGKIRYWNEVRVNSNTLL